MANKKSYSEMMEDAKGIMFFHEDYLTVSNLSNEKLGLLFRSVMEFSINGIIPELDMDVGMAFNFLKPKITYSKEKYAQKCLSSEYSVYSRQQKKRNNNGLDYEDWLALNHPEMFGEPPMTDEGHRSPNRNTNENGDRNTTKNRDENVTQELTQAQEHTGKGVLREDHIAGLPIDPTGDILREQSKQKLRDYADGKK